MRIFERIDFPKDYGVNLLVELIGRTLIDVLMILCIMAIISASIFGILYAYPELIVGEPMYGIYMKVAALIIGIAGFLAPPLSVIREKYIK